MRTPRATYRLQFSSAFRFADAGVIAGYLDKLGISDIYASPIFAARSGSPHGYDVVDPTRLNPELGGRDDFDALAGELRSRGMGLLLDIVPNHMAASTENTWWADVLARGRSSPYAAYFDIDWDSEYGEPSLAGKLLLPVLGRPLQEVLAAGELTVEREGEAPFLRYYETRLPLAPESHELAESLPDGDAAALRRLLDAQHYWLEYWRTGAAIMNYRRFFDITELVGVRVEEPAVFEATHALALSLVREGIVTGLRVDHIDGLRDPLGYLETLQSRLPRQDGGPFYVVVEKILSGEERLPDGWPVAGTTGYEFTNAVNRVFVDPAGLDRLRSFYDQWTDSRARFDDVLYGAKKQIMRDLFAVEVSTLSRRLQRLASGDPAARDVRAEYLTTVLVETAAAFDVYRTYDRGDGMSAADRRYVEAALEAASRQAPGLPPEAFDFLRRVILEPGDIDAQQRREFIARWQQFSGPAMAKGLEDTAFYRYHALVSLNDVGGDPRLSAGDVDAFHRFNAERQRSWPGTLNATSTHDTKRSEDVRARLDVLSEVTDAWSARARSWRRLNAAKKRNVDGHLVPAPDEEMLIYQTLVGAWPLDEAEVAGFGERVQAYVRKAAREAKLRTSWHEPNEAHEQALVAFVGALFDDADGPWMADFRPFQERVAALGALNSLSQLVLKVASPGVPDFYQGSELWDFSLIDPDNRRPVDFAVRSEMLDELRDRPIGAPLADELLRGWKDGRIKMYVTWKALEMRSAHTPLFANGDYIPLAATGPRADNVVAFARRAGHEWAVAVVPRLVAALSPHGRPPLGARLWAETSLVLPEGAPVAWRDVFTGAPVETDGGGTVPLAAVFRHLPVALLTIT